mgnify:FL=1
MAEVKRCSKCGREVPQIGSFCPFCGNIINDKVVVESRKVGRYEIDDDTQKKYRNDINSKLQKQKELENEKKNLLKKKKSLELKIDNYNKIIEKKIPHCERNKIAPDLPVTKIETSKVDTKWYIAAVIAVLEIISGFMPWVTLYYVDLFQGGTISCTGIFNLLNDISEFDEWTNSASEVFGVFVFIIMMGFVMLFINGYFIARVLQKRESEAIGTIAGISGIVVSTAVLLYKWYLDSSMEEDGWQWLSVDTQAGLWLMLLAGIALIGVIVFYKSDVRTQTRNNSDFEFEVMNYDPVLPIRMKTLKVSKENERITLELTYAEFEWANIEEFIVDIQLVRYDGAVSTFIKNALFEKKGENFARFQLQDVGYDLDGITSARVNILEYNVYKNMKKQEEKGSGFSAYSDYSVDELRSARFANSNIVMCSEKNIGEYHQCCCGQIYLNKNNICPLCGKKKKGI